MAGTLNPFALYDTSEAAALVGVSEQFLVRQISKAVQQGVIQPLQDWKIQGLS